MTRKHAPKYKYDCARCKFSWQCGFSCDCVLSKAPNPPEPIQNMVDYIQRRNREADGYPEHAYKLVRKMKDGSLSSLFIGCRNRLSVGEWMNAEALHRKGFAFRPGWHCTMRPFAPHLKKEGRVWIRVQVIDYTEMYRPESQGGLWLLANKMKIIEEVQP